MTCECGIYGSVSLVRMAGDVDIESTGTLAILEDILINRDGVVLDVSGLEYVDTTFLTFLIRLAKRINNEQSTPIELIGVRPNLLKLFEITGFSNTVAPLSG